jgi:hypothetical protein
MGRYSTHELRALARPSSEVAGLAHATGTVWARSLHQVCTRGGALACGPRVVQSSH